MLIPVCEISPFVFFVQVNTLSLVGRRVYQPVNKTQWPPQHSFNPYFRGKAITLLYLLWHGAAFVLISPDFHISDNNHVGEQVKKPLLFALLLSLAYRKLLSGGNSTCPEKSLKQLIWMCGRGVTWIGGGSRVVRYLISPNSGHTKLLSPSPRPCHVTCSPALSLVRSANPAILLVEWGQNFLDRISRWSGWLDCPSKLSSMFWLYPGSSSRYYR